VISLGQFGSAQQTSSHLPNRGANNTMSGFLGRFRKNSTGGEAEGAAAVESAVKEKEATPQKAPAADAKNGSKDNKGKKDDAEKDESVTEDPETAPVAAANEPTEDPERSQLEEVVRQRDASVSALEKARLEKQQQLVALEAELEKERLTQMKEALLHKIESERIKKQTANAEERLKCLETDMQDKAAIHEYANLIKGVAPKTGVDSQYVMKLQSQLQKAVAKMEATTEQMKALEESSNQVVDSLTLEIAELVEERCRTELDLRKQLEILEGQKKEMQENYEERIRTNLKTLQALKAKATSQITIQELEEELEETETKLAELQRIQEKQQKTVQQLNKSLAAGQDMGM
jgi:chromosome segregation ATPase